MALRAVASPSTPLCSLAGGAGAGGSVFCGPGSADFVGTGVPARSPTSGPSCRIDSFAGPTPPTQTCAPNF